MNYTYLVKRGDEYLVKRAGFVITWSKAREDAQKFDSTISARRAARNIVDAEVVKK
jgi:hypothetical protein